MTLNQCRIWSYKTKQNNNNDISNDEEIYKQSNTTKYIDETNNNHKPTKQQQQLTLIQSFFNLYSDEKHDKLTETNNIAAKINECF